jgi:hypothetical protein
VDDAALVGEGHVRACEDVVGDCLAEDFDAEDIGNSSSLSAFSLFTLLFFFPAFLRGE